MSGPTENLNPIEISEMTEDRPSSYEHIAKHLGLSPEQTQRYKIFMRHKFPGAEHHICAGKEAVEWGQRFKNGSEYNYSGSKLDVEILKFADLHDSHQRRH